MQKVTIDVSEDYLVKFLNVLEALPKNKVKLNDNLSKELEKRINEVEISENASIPFEEGLDLLKEKITAKYAN